MNLRKKPLIIGAVLAIGLLATAGGCNDPSLLRDKRKWGGR